MRSVLRTSVAGVILIAGAAMANAQSESAGSATGGAASQGGSVQGVHGDRGQWEGRSESGRGTGSQELKSEDRSGQGMGSTVDQGGVSDGEGRSTTTNDTSGVKSRSEQDRGLDTRGTEGRSTTRQRERDDNDQGLREERGERNIDTQGGRAGDRSEGRSVTRQRDRDDMGVQDRERNRGERNSVEERSQSGGGLNREGRSSYGVSSDQQKQIHEHLMRGRVARVDHVGFDVRVGTVVPRTGVRFATLPRDVVRIVPRYRGFRYFVVGDEIVIVDPHTFRIVAVING